MLQLSDILLGKPKKGKSFPSHKYLRDVHFNRAPLSGRAGSVHHHPDAFISEELTTYFPADGCKAHVLVYDSDEDIRQDIQEGVRIVGQPSTAKTMAHNLYGIAYHFYRNKLDPELIEMVKKGIGNGVGVAEKWFAFVNQLSNKVLSHFGNHILDHASGANLFKLFHSLGSAGALFAVLAPYSVAFSVFSKEKQLSEKILERFTRKHSIGREEGRERVT